MSYSISLVWPESTQITYAELWAIEYCHLKLLGVEIFEFFITSTLHLSQDDNISILQSMFLTFRQRNHSLPIYSINVDL